MATTIEDQIASLQHDLGVLVNSHNNLANKVVVLEEKPAQVTATQFAVLAGQASEDHATLEAHDKILAELDTEGLAQIARDRFGYRAPKKLS